MSNIKISGNVYNGVSTIKVKSADDESKLVSFYEDAGSSDVAIQDDKSVTITSNGTTTITPDASYDVMSKVDVTVDVSSPTTSYTTVTIQPETTEQGLPFAVLYKSQDGYHYLPGLDSSEQIILSNVELYSRLFLFEVLLNNSSFIINDSYSVGITSDYTDCFIQNSDDEGGGVALTVTAEDAEVFYQIITG